MFQRKEVFEEIIIGNFHKGKLLLRVAIRIGRKDKDIFQHNRVKFNNSKDWKNLYKFPEEQKTLKEENLHYLWLFIEILDTTNNIFKVKM